MAIQATHNDSDFMMSGDITPFEQNTIRGSLNLQNDSFTEF